MKKLLALVLALVMTLSLATVSTNAAFDDADNIDYTEAVEVMNAIGVLEGDGTGNFNPKGILNREQAAKILSIVLLGKSTANKLGVSEIKFADVKTTDWAAPYIAYCAANGIVVGDGTNFYPKAELTGHAFAKMLLVALGAKGTYTGADWAINVAVDAQNYDLDENLDIVLSNPITREEAAQMALNALNYTADDSYVYAITVGTGDDAPSYTFDNLNDALLYAALLDGASNPKPIPVSTDTLLYKTFGVTRYPAAKDSFGRPATLYSNKSNTVYKLFVDEPAYTYAGENFKAGLFSTGALSDYDVTNTATYYNGAAAAYKTYYKQTGAEVEVYVEDDEITTIVVAEAAPYEINKSTDRKGVVTFTATSLENEKLSFEGKSNAETGTTSKSNYNKLSGYNKYDVVAAYVKTSTVKDEDNEGKESTVYSLLKVADTDTIEGKITALNNTYEYVKVDGETYNFSKKLDNAKKLANRLTGTFYLYNGCLFHFAADSKVADVSDLVYVAYAWQVQPADNAKDEWGTDISGTIKNYAQIIHLDGTTEVVEVAHKAGYPALRYVKDITDGVYTFATYDNWSKTGYAVDMIKAGTEINKSKISGTDYAAVRLNSETKNVISNGKNKDDLKVTTSTGIANVKLSEAAYVIGTVSGSNLTAEYVFVPGTASVEVLGDMVYVTEASGETTDIYDTTAKKYVTRDVYVAYNMKGDEVVLNVAQSNNVEYAWVTYTTNTDGVSTFTPVTDDWDSEKLVGVIPEITIDDKNDFYDTYLLTKADDLDIEDAVILNLTNVSVADVDALISKVTAGYDFKVSVASDGKNVVIVILEDVSQD